MACLLFDSTVFLLACHRLYVRFLLSGHWLYVYIHVSISLRARVQRTRADIFGISSKNRLKHRCRMNRNELLSACQRLPDICRYIILHGEEAAARRAVALTRRSYTWRHLWRQLDYVTKPNIIARYFSSGKLPKRVAFCILNEFTTSPLSMQLCQICLYGVKSEEMHRSIHRKGQHIVLLSRTN